MLSWLKLPFDIPNNGQVVWVRVPCYYSAPFLAVFNSSTNEFTSVTNSIVFPAWSVARWAVASGINLINNPLFTDLSFWTTESAWSISGGKAHYNDSASNWLYQSCEINNGVTYDLSFDVSGVLTFARIAFTWDGNQGLFNGDLATFIDVSDGSYSYTVQATRDHGFFEVQGLTNGSVFAITNFNLHTV